LLDQWSLISWGLWFGFAMGIGAVIAGAILRIFGRESSGAFMLGGTASVLIASFGWELVRSLYGGSSPPLQYGWIFYAVSGALVAVSSAYLALGRMDEGVKLFASALLIVGIGFFSASFASGAAFGRGGSISVECYTDSSFVNSGELFNLTVRLSGGTPPYNLEVEWGDGSTDSATAGEEPLALSHSYSLPSNESYSSFPVRINAQDSEGREGYDVFAIVVRNPGYNPYSFPFSIIYDVAQKASIAIPAIDLQKLTFSPTLPESGAPHEIYSLVLDLSLGALGAFLAFNIAWEAVARGRAAEAVVEGIKDAVVVALISLLFPSVFNATAELLNYLSSYLIQQIDVTWVFVAISAEIASAVVLGYFIPFLAEYVAMMGFAVLTASVFVYVRYFMILTLAVSSPLIAVSYLHPAMRGAARWLVSMLSGMMLAGPIAAVFLVLMSKMMPGRDITFAFLYPFFAGVIPSILGIFGSGAVAGVAREAIAPLSIAFRGRLRSASRDAGSGGSRAERNERSADAEADYGTVKLRVPSMHEGEGPELQQLGIEGYSAERQGASPRRKGKKDGGES